MFAVPVPVRETSVPRVPWLCSGPESDCKLEADSRGLSNEAVEKPGRATRASPRSSIVELSSGVGSVRRDLWVLRENRYVGADTLAGRSGPYSGRYRIATPATFSMLCTIVKSFHCALTFF